MTGWHPGDDALRRYVDRTDSAPEGASVEQHLMSCALCRATVSDSVRSMAISGGRNPP